MRDYSLTMAYPRPQTSLPRRCLQHRRFQPKCLHYRFHCQCVLAAYGCEFADGVAIVAVQMPLTRLGHWVLAFHLHVVGFRQHSPQNPYGPGCLVAQGRCYQLRSSLPVVYRHDRHCQSARRWTGQIQAFLLVCNQFREPPDGVAKSLTGMAQSFPQPTHPMLTLPEAGPYHQPG